MPEDDILSLLISAQGDIAISPIIDCMRRAGLTDAGYAYKFRVKSKDDLLSKKQRKLPEKPHYALTDITDVIGVRLVTLFKGEMFDVYANLIELLAKPSSDTQFFGAVPEEIIVYNGTSALNEFANEIEKITKTHFHTAQVKIKNSVEGYSSIHVICRHRDAINEISKSGNVYRLPIEIQIRTVFEDAWGEIDHKYGYVERQGKNAGKPIHNSHHVKAHLKVLKGFTDACMEYAECIRKEALPDTLDLTSGVTKTLSVESDLDVLQRFKELNLEDDFIERYAQATALRDKAAAESGDTHDGRLPTKQKFLEAAELFDELAQNLLSSDDVVSLKDGPRFAYYHCAMNEGFCLTSTNIPEHVTAAIERYQSLEAHYTDFPIIKMRLGQALAKVGKVDESIEKLRKAGFMFREQGQQSLVTLVWTDKLPKADYEHMLYTQPKLLGYSLWKKSQRSDLSFPQERADLYYEAYNTTLKCKEATNLDKKKKVDISNNLLYYCVGFAFSALATDKRREYIKKEIPSLLASMVEESGGTEQMSIEDLDTVFRAYAFLQEPVAKDIAATLIGRCLQPDANLSDALRLSIAEVAQRYITSGTIINM
jgi:ppGpp synthetase/RelA/SpoT-type nucleotidyltranferase